MGGRVTGKVVEVGSEVRSEMEVEAVRGGVSGPSQIGREWLMLGQEARGPEVKVRAFHLASLLITPLHWQGSAATTQNAATNIVALMIR